MEFNGISKKEATMRLKEFLKSGMSYTEHQLNYIYNNFYSSDMNFLLSEIYAHLGLLNDEENLYLNFAKRVLEKYGKNVNIADIACGCYPIFSEYIRDMNENKSIIIDAYDPLLALKNIDRINLHKEDFNEKTNVDQSDLLVGILPCEATESIIRKAISNDKEFYVAMCDCIHLSFDNMIILPFRTNSLYEYYVECMYSLAREIEKDDYDVSIEYIDQSILNFKQPIISGKRKVKTV